MCSATVQNDRKLNSDDLRDANFEASIISSNKIEVQLARVKIILAQSNRRIAASEQRLDKSASTLARANLLLAVFGSPRNVD